MLPTRRHTLRLLLGSATLAALPACTPATRKPPMPPARLRLVTRGDDAGSCPSADRALIEAATQGLLRNISIMVPGPTFAAAAPRLRELRGIALGLHTTLNAEWDTVKWGPVLPRDKVPSLVDERGFFTQNPRLLNDRKADPDQMLAEVQAQLDQARAAGLAIAYLDEHMGVGWLPGLRDRLSRLCEREGLVDAVAKVKALPRPPKPAPAAPPPARPATPYDDLLSRLRAAAPGAYVYVTHPGFDAPDMQAFRHAGLAQGQIARERDLDRRLWTDPRLPPAFADLGVEVARYTDVA